MTGCAATLVNDGVVIVGFVILVITIALEAPALKGICGTDAERVSVLGVRALRSWPKKLTLGVDGIVTAGRPKSLVGVGILAVDPTNGVVIARV